MDYLQQKEMGVDVEYMIHVLQRFNEHDFCCQGIYEVEPELLATVSEARVRIIF
jgi:hypothetical protein